MAGLGSANAGDDAWSLLHPARVRQLFQPVAKLAITKGPGGDSPLGNITVCGARLCYLCAQTAGLAHRRSSLTDNVHFRERWG